MRRPVVGLMGIYDRHALAHHQFLADVEPSFDSSRDFRVELFPPHASAAFVTRSLAPAALPNVDWRLITNVALYLNDELFRSCCHVRDDRIVRRIPLVNTIRRHRGLDTHRQSLAATLTCRGKYAAGNL